MNYYRKQSCRGHNYYKVKCCKRRCSDTSESECENSRSRSKSDSYDEKSWNNWYTRIIKFEIKPLLEEYWFDNKEKVSDLLERIK